MKTNKNFTNPIFIGSSIKTIIQLATSSLIANFILDYSVNAYTLQQLGACVLGLITSVALLNKAINNITKKYLGSELNDICWNNFNKFMVIEAIVRGICGLATLLIGTPLICLILGLLMTPYSIIQSLGINCLQSKLFKNLEERKEYDDFKTKTESIIGIVGYLIGFLINYICSEPVAFLLVCIADIIDNVFYLKAYRSVMAEEEPVEAEDEEDETDDEAATAEV